MIEPPASARERVLGRVADHLAAAARAPVRVVVNDLGLAAELAEGVAVRGGAGLLFVDDEDLWYEKIFSGPDAAENAPEDATIVLGDDDPDRPVLHRIGGPAGATARLFSYGALRLPAVQAAYFGHELTGTPDTLPGHRQDWITITDPAVIAASGTDRHPIVRATGNPADATGGIVLVVTTAELATADLHEADDYRRARVRLASGLNSWVYLAAR